jgi:hypothetical protein
MEMTFLCKKCKKAFRKDMTTYEESDEYCPHCDNHYVRVLLPLPLSRRLLWMRWGDMILILLHRDMQVLDAKTPQAVVEVEGEDVRVDSRYVSLRRPSLMNG